jgi:hypothetical protein
MGATQTKSTTMTTMSNHFAVRALEHELGEFKNEHELLKSVIVSLISEQSNADPSMVDYDTLSETINKMDLVILSINKLKELIAEYK